MSKGWRRAGSGTLLRLVLPCLLTVLLCPLAQAGNDQPWPLWESYAAKFLDAQGRVIDHGTDDRTTTEGQAYAMFFALVAKDRARFDKLVDWTEAGTADPSTPGLRELLGRMAGMGTYLQDHLTPPLRVDANGKVVDENAPAGFSAALIPYLQALNMKKQAQEQQDRLTATRDKASCTAGLVITSTRTSRCLPRVGWSNGIVSKPTGGCA